MKKILLTLMVLAFTAGFSNVMSAQGRDWAAFNRYAEDNAKIKKAPRAVFYGDSITDIWARNHDDFFSANKFLGRGISGQTTSEMLVRLRQDVLDIKPRTMVLLAGINDIARNNGYITVENIFNNIVSMVELCKLHKIAPVLCTVFPTTSIPWREEVGDPTEMISSLNARIREYGAANKIPVVDYFPADFYVQGRLAEKYSKDGVHPTAEGYAVMQEAILSVLK